MPKSSYIPFIIGLVAVFAICCLAISGSFSTTLREGFFDSDVKTSGVLGIGRKAPDSSVSRWEGQPMRAAGASYTGKLNEDALGIPISSNPTAGGNYTLTNEQCPAIPRPTKWGSQGCSQYRASPSTNPKTGVTSPATRQCGPAWDPNVTNEWTKHPPDDINPQPYWTNSNGDATVKKPKGWGEPPPPASWCDYNPAPSINGGKPLCVMENQCSKGDLCDLETQRCATPDSNYILVETQTQCPLKPAPNMNWITQTGAVEGGALRIDRWGIKQTQWESPEVEGIRFEGPDNAPTQTCVDTNNKCPKICQAPGKLGWDGGIAYCQTLYGARINEGVGLMPLDDIAGASCTNSGTNLPNKCAFKQSCPSGQLCDMTKNKCMALCKKGDEKCKTEAMGPPPPPGTWRPGWPLGPPIPSSCKDKSNVTFKVSDIGITQLTGDALGITGDSSTTAYQAANRKAAQKKLDTYGCVLTGNYNGSLGNFGWPGTCTTTCAKAGAIGLPKGMGWQGGSDNSNTGPPQAVLDACPVTTKSGCADISNWTRVGPPVRKDCPSLRGEYPNWALNIYTPGKAGADNDDTRTCEDVVQQGGTPWVDPGWNPDNPPPKEWGKATIYNKMQQEAGWNCHGCSVDAKLVKEKPLNPWGYDACECDPVYRIGHFDDTYDAVGIGGEGMVQGQKQCRYSAPGNGGVIGSGCSGRGVCTNTHQYSGQCVCDKGYTGIDCSVKVDDPSANVIPASLPPAWCGWMDPAVGPGPWEVANPPEIKGKANKWGRSWMKTDGWAAADAPSPIGVNAGYCAEKPPRGWTEGHSALWYTGPRSGDDRRLKNLKDYKHEIVAGCILSTTKNPILGCDGYVGGSSPPPSGSSPPPSGSSPPPSGSSPPPSGSSPPPSGSSPPPSGSSPTPSGSSPTPSGSSPTPSGSSPTPSGSSPTPSGSSSPPPSGSSSTPTSGSNSGSHQYINPERQINRYVHRNGRTYKKGQYQPAPNPHFHLQTQGAAYTCKAGQQWCVALQKCSLLNDCPK